MAQNQPQPQHSIPQNSPASEQLTRPSPSLTGSHLTGPHLTGPHLIGIDVGGTFTDFVVLEPGAAGEPAQLRVHKVPTTPHDQSEAIAAGLDELKVQQAQIVHGMTVATNALLERKGARTALLATAGFADVLVIGRQNRPHIYRLTQSRPPTLVADGLRFDVPERLDAQGSVLTALDQEAVEEIAQELARQNVESVAVAFLFAFRNPTHEQAAAAALRRLLPQVPLSLSSEILPEYREYERTATTVINAYVQPLVARYLAQLAKRLGTTQIRIMQSNGGAIGLDQAAEQAARVVLSGPAGGVVGAFALARQAQPPSTPSAPDATPGHSPEQMPHIMTFDMGGTSTDVALCPGEIPTTAEGTITDLPLRLPIIDIHTVGAGGGSIAYVDAGGALRAGPQSAGAVPGPACYGRGGSLPTVTDANLVLGRLDPQGFLGGGGSVHLDADAAQRALQTLADTLNLSIHETALGVIQVANATMERALRQVSVERGHDPRRFSLIPFGGAGPLHACELAQSLAMSTILIPPIPGVLSAYGMLVADVVHDLSQTVLAPLDSLSTDPQPLNLARTRLIEQLQTLLQSEQIAHPRLETALDLRYRGQSYELTVGCPVAPNDPILAPQLEAARDAFHAAHAQRYGYAMQQEPIEVVNLRMRGIGPGAQAQLPTYEPQGADPAAAQLGEKPVWFTADAPLATALYDRSRLRPDHQIPGPALIYQYDATVLITPGWVARVDRFLNLWLQNF